MLWVRRFICIVVSTLVAFALAQLGATRADPQTGNCGYEPGDIYAQEFQCYRYGEFYTPPDPLPPGQPGDVIRSEPSRLVLEPSGQLGSWVATGTRIMYRSTDARGNPIAVTGTYLEPDNPWPGRGPRPLLVYATGTVGMGDQCATSRLLNQGIHFSSGWDVTMNYEETMLTTLVARGYAVVVTDYQGLGTPGAHPYVNRLAGAHAVLDAARAAQRLKDTSLPPDGPVALFGYSEGGGASAAAAELASSYAPELNMVGTYAGAPPADLKATLPYVDGGATFVLGYLINGALATYPEIGPMIHAHLTPRGEHFLNDTSDVCVVQSAIRTVFRHISSYFDADPYELMNEEPFSSILDLQRIGTLKPNAPVFVDSNRYDPLVPWTAANQMAQDWCAKGSDVQFWTNEEPPFLNKIAVNHFLTAFVDGERAFQWIADRFNGEPTTPNCDNIANW